MKRIWIAGIGHHLPPQVVTNAQIIEENALRIKASWVEGMIGIRERRWALPEVAASDMAVAAAHGLPLSGFRGSVWVSTISPDYLTPSTASIVKRKLGIAGDAPAFDLSAACAGQLFALEAAVHRMRATGEREALVIATEVRSRFLNRRDRRTVFLFGDGASAWLLRQEALGDGAAGGSDAGLGEVEWVLSRTRASAEFEILVPGGGSVLPLSAAVLDQDLQYIRMNDGVKISELTTSTLLEELRQTLAARQLTPADFDFYVFHQGNGAISRKILEALAVDPAKTWSNFDRFGNTSSASLGIALSEAASLGKIRTGDRVLLMAMGAGYHFSIASVRWGLG